VSATDAFEGENICSGAGSMLAWARLKRAGELLSLKWSRVSEAAARKPHRWAKRYLG
jgi:hypothetical protein